MCIQNLKFIALPNPEIIGVPKNIGSLWRIPDIMPRDKMPQDKMPRTKWPRTKCHAEKLTAGQNATKKETTPDKMPLFFVSKIRCSTLVTSNTHMYRMLLAEMYTDQ